MACSGAAHGEASVDRLVRRNGQRGRDRETPAGTVELRTLRNLCSQSFLRPKPRKGSYFSGFLVQRRMAGKALAAVIQEASIKGISARSADELVKAIGVSGISKSEVSRHETRARSIAATAALNIFTITKIDHRWQNLHLQIR